MRVLEVCAGIGGFSLAAEWMGWEVAGHVEIDPFCTRVLKHHWPDVPHHDNLFTLEGDALANLLYPIDERREIDILGAKRKDYEEAVRLYESGFSIGETASYYGMSRQAMWAILTRRGVEMRPNLRYGEENHFHRGGAASDGRAHDIVEKAILRGHLERKKSCETCGGSPVDSDGESGVVAHHDDYNKPLDVRWLCRTCHFQWHQNHEPIRKEVMPDDVRREAIDLLCGGIP